MESKAEIWLYLSLNHVWKVGFQILILQLTFRYTCLETTIEKFLLNLMTPVGIIWIEPGLFSKPWLGGWIGFVPVLKYIFLNHSWKVGIE